jgi:hypothetical protein
MRMMGMYLRSFEVLGQRCSQMGVIERTEVLRLRRIRSAYQARLDAQCGLTKPSRLDKLGV